MKERILAFIREKAYKPLAAAELAEALRVPEQQMGQFLGTLDRMESEGLTIKTRLGRYGAPERMNLAVGRLQGHPRGFAFLAPEVQPEAVTGDVFIGPENMAGALHGDRVVVRLSPPSRPGARVEGEVIRILSRATDRFVGTYEGTRTGGYVTPDDPRLAHDFIIPRGQAGGARPGEKVVVRITRWPEPRRPGEGHVLERLGPAGDPGVDILSIIRKHNLPEAFPAKVLQAAELIPDQIPVEEYPRRTDLRDRLIITIDGADARDLDDAVHVEKLPNGRWRLGVHIADVAHYVREDSPLDREALRRGTSVYLADRVVPMLPPKLSNGVCSLQPGTDKLTLTAEMEINAEGQVVAHKLYPSVIRTVHRMTYGDVWRILQGDAGLAETYANVLPMLREMHALMQVLRQKRQRRGSLDFDLPEAKLVLDEGGFPLEVRRAERTDAERIIEEFMLAANETVAKHFAALKVPFVFRIHPAPDPARLEDLSVFLGLFGYHLDHGQEVTPTDLQKITAWAAGRKEEGLINTVLLRSMQQARYHHENSGHFGLAAEFYCHFTSPIRRYPDLVVHRIMREVWEHKGQLPARRQSRLQRFVEEAARQSSERERLAVEAERETYDLKKAQYMQDKVGEVFEGIISGVQPFGFFVQLPNTVEGLVHVSTLTDDYYHFHDKHYALVGERTRKMYRLGDPVAVRLASVNLAGRRLEFMLEAEAMPAVPVAPEWVEGRPAAPQEQGAERAGAGRDKGQRHPRPARRAAETPDAGGAREGKMPPAAHRAEPDAATAAPGPVTAPPAQAPPPRKVAKKGEDQPLHRQPTRVRKDGEGVPRDMWGVPIPGGRRRPAEDDEESPGLIFSIAPAMDRRRGRKPAVGSPPPAPGITDELSGFPAVPVPPPPEGAAPAEGQKRRRSRRTRGKKKSAAAE